MVWEELIFLEKPYHAKSLSQRFSTYSLSGLEIVITVGQIERFAN